MDELCDNDADIDSDDLKDGVANFINENLRNPTTDTDTTDDTGDDTDVSESSETSEEVDENKEFEDCWNSLN